MNDCIISILLFFSWMQMSMKIRANSPVTCSTSQLVRLLHLRSPRPCPMADRELRTWSRILELPLSVSLHTSFPLFHLAFVFAFLCKSHPSLNHPSLHHCPQILSLSSVPHRSSLPFHLPSSPSFSLSLLHLFGVFPEATRGQKGP